MSDEGGESDSRTKRQQCPVAPISRPAHHSSSTMCINITKKIEIDNTIQLDIVLFSGVYYSQSWFSLLLVLGLWSCKCTYNKDAPIASFLYCCCCCGLYNYLLFVKTSTSNESFLKSSASVLVVLMNIEKGLSTKIQLVEKVIDDLACEQK